MVERISLRAADGHAFDAWRADPAVPAKGGIVILHAIYGLTSHMGDVCDLYAESGIAAIAPALYDRTAKDIVFGYDRAGLDAGTAQRETLAEGTVLMDIQAAADALRPAGPVAVQGFCTGGSWAWIAAARLALDAAVIYYGSDVYEERARRPACPAILHYGDRDPIVPIDRLETIRGLHQSQDFHVYPGAGHAFFNPEQGSYDKGCAEAAHARSIAFLNAKFGAVQ